MGPKNSKHLFTEPSSMNFHGMHFNGGENWVTMALGCRVTEFTRYLLSEIQSQPSTTTSTIGLCVCHGWDIPLMTPHINREWFIWFYGWKMQELCMLCSNESGGDASVWHKGIWVPCSLPFDLGSNLVKGWWWTCAINLMNVLCVRSLIPCRVSTSLILGIGVVWPRISWEIPQSCSAACAEARIHALQLLQPWL